MILTLCGAVLAWALVDARQVQRADGSRVVLMKHPSWRSEFLGLWETIRTDTWVIFLFPMFFASNWFYTYQFNDGNIPDHSLFTWSHADPHQSIWHYSILEPGLSTALYTGPVKFLGPLFSAMLLILRCSEEVPRQKRHGGFCSFLRW